jgi:hypothetical protein
MSTYFQFIYRNKNLYSLRQFFVELLPLLSLFFVWLLDLFNFANDNIYYSFFKLLLILFIPGIYVCLIINSYVGFTYSELFILLLGLNLSLLLLLPIYLTYFNIYLSSQLIFYFLLIFNLLSFLLFKSKYNEKKFIPLNINIFYIIQIILCFSISVFLISKVIPSSYWRGWDPWVNSPIGNAILINNFSPINLANYFSNVYNVDISGFYYFLVSINILTKINFYLITRYSPFFFLGCLNIITFVIINKKFNKYFSLLCCVFLNMNPFLITRFSMTIRENFSFLMLLIIIFIYINIYEQNKKHNLLFIFVTIITFSIMISALFSSHVLTALLFIIFMGIFNIYLLKKEQYFSMIKILLIFLLSIFLLIPYYDIYLNFIFWQYNKQLAPYTLFIIISIFLLLAVLFLIKILNKKINFIKYYKYSPRIILSIFLITIINYIYKNDIILTPILNNYNFSIFIILFSIIGIIFSLKYLPEKVFIIYSLVISIIIIFFNLTYNTAKIPLDRIYIYTIWILTYFSIIPLFYISLKIKSLNINILFKIHNKNKKINVNTFYFILIFFLLVPGITIDLSHIKAGSQNYLETDHESTITFIKILNSTDVVVPQKFTSNILIYNGINIKNIINDGKLLNELYLTKSYDEFIELIKNNYPNCTNIKVFTLKRFSRLYGTNIPQKEILNSIGTEVILNNVRYYDILIPRKKLTLLNHTINITNISNEITFLDIKNFNIIGYEKMYINLSSNSKIDIALTLVTNTDVISNELIINLESKIDSYFITLNDFNLFSNEDIDKLTVKFISKDKLQSLSLTNISVYHYK